MLTRTLTIVGGVLLTLVAFSPAQGASYKTPFSPCYGNLSTWDDKLRPHNEVDWQWTSLNQWKDGKACLGGGHRTCGFVKFDDGKSGSVVVGPVKSSSASSFCVESERRN